MTSGHRTDKVFFFSFLSFFPPPLEQELGCAALHAPPLPRSVEKTDRQEEKNNVMKRNDNEETRDRSESAHDHDDHDDRSLGASSCFSFSPAPPPAKLVDA